MNQRYDQQIDGLWELMQEIENKLIYAQTVISARKMTIELLTGVVKLRENYNCDALGQLREMVITSGNCSDSE